MKKLTLEDFVEEIKGQQKWWSNMAEKNCDPPYEKAVRCSHYAEAMQFMLLRYKELNEE